MKFQQGLPLAFALCLAFSCATPRGTPKPTVAQGEALERGTGDGSDSEPRVEADDPRIHLATIEPYFDRVMGGRAAMALREDRLADALEGFDDIAAALEDDELRLRAEFLGAYLAYYTGDDGRALTRLPILARRLPLLQDVAYEVSALAAFRMGRFELALEYAKLIGHDSPTKGMLMADSRRRLEDYQTALELYRQVATRWPKSDRYMESKARMVECVAKTSAGRGPSSPGDSGEGEPGAEGEAEGEPGVDELVKEALNIIRILRAQSSNGYWTRHAANFESDLQRLAGVETSRDRRESKQALDLYEKAKSDMSKKNNERAFSRYAKVIRIARQGGELQCKARYEQALVTSFMRDHAHAADLFGEVANDCESPRIRIRALYKGAKSAMSSDRYEDAIALFGKVEELFPEHSYADDARLHAARAHLALGREETFMDMVTSLSDDYPSGDMRGEALWLGSKLAMDNEDLQRAHDLLSRYYNIFPIESGWYTAGRSGYWLGRIEQRLGHGEEAMAHYEYVISTTPFSYYMVMAYSRLLEMDPSRAQLFVDRLVPHTGDDREEIPARLVETPSGFALGVELVRLGLVSRGKKVLDEVLGQPDSKPELHRAAAALFRHVGKFSEAKEFSTSARDGWKDRYPAGADFESWTLAYPKAFEAQVDLASKESGVDRALLWAVIREESGFNTKVESWANAIGLMQLILPTARSMGKTLDMKVNRKTLKDPESNIRLGAAYLAYLGDMFDRHPALVISGYNAGGGAVGRWLDERGDMDLDMFVESIPYSQTRGYTKRVLSSFAVYSFLYSEGRPFISIESKLR